MTGPTVDGQGRVVVPAEERDEWDVVPGDEVTVRVDHPKGGATDVEDDLDSRGRVTIPKPDRDALGIAAGDRVAVTIHGVDGGFTCDVCGQDGFGLAEVAIFDRGTDRERVVCVDDLQPADRVV